MCRSSKASWESVVPPVVHVAHTMSRFFTIISASAVGFPLESSIYLVCNF